VHAERPWTRLVTLVTIVAGWSAATTMFDRAVADATSETKASSTTVSTTLTFVDATRQRTLVTTFVTSRRATGSLPLLVFVHGYDQSPSDYRTLLRAWASAGYVVAAPRFPATSHDAAGGLDATDYRNEPMDVSFLITRVVAQSAAPTGPLAGKVDPARIGVAGHSLGAEVVLGLLNRCCRDPRVRAAISLAGSEQFNPGQAAFPTDGYFVGPPIPLLLVHGDADQENPYNRSVTAFSGAPAPKFFETIHGGDHRRPYQESVGHPAAHAVATVTVDFLDAYLKGQRAALGRLARDGTVPGTAALQAVPS
jgi:poly(3-hydroxybutyrate) depolymerase